jgi:hypothetical protein
MPPFVLRYASLILSGDVRIRRGVAYVQSTCRVKHVPSPLCHLGEELSESDTTAEEKGLQSSLVLPLVDSVVSALCYALRDPR